MVANIVSTVKKHGKKNKRGEGEDIFQAVSAKGAFFFFFFHSYLLYQPHNQEILLGAAPFWSQGSLTVGHCSLAVDKDPNFNVIFSQCRKHSV